MSSRLTAREAIIALLALACFLSVPARALPIAANVAGGIAILKLATITESAQRPQAWLGQQQVWVADEKGQWVAIVGLALDLAAGPHTLRVAEKNAERSVDFEVAAKRYPEQRITLKDKGKVELSPQDEARAIAEIEEIGKLKRHWREDVETSGDFVLPAPGKRSSRFGLRRFFNGQARAPHSGLDLALAHGTAVGASERGKVLAIGDYFFNGKTVFVDHGNGLISMYCHLERIDVAAGESVSTGQRLGLSGMSGRASGPHLHWSVILNGVMVDPALFVKN